MRYCHLYIAYVWYEELFVWQWDFNWEAITPSQSWSSILDMRSSGAHG